MTFRAVVFDLDGLMFDTEALFFRVSSEALAARGKSFTPEIMQAMIGRRSVDAGHALKSLAGLDEPVEAVLSDVRQRFYALMDMRRASDTGTFRFARSPEPAATATGCRDLVAAVVRRAPAGGAPSPRSLSVRTRSRGRHSRQARPGDLSHRRRAIQRARRRNARARRQRGGNCRRQGRRRVRRRRSARAQSGPWRYLPRTWSSRGSMIRR